MTTKRTVKSEKVQKPDNSDGWRGFVNLSFDSDDRARVKAKCKEESALLDAMVDLAENGFKTSHYWDSESECYCVTATGTKASVSSSGCAVSSRSLELLACYVATWYKVAELCSYNLSVHLKGKNTEMDV